MPPKREFESFDNSLGPDTKKHRGLEYTIKSSTQSSKSSDYDSGTDDDEAYDIATEDKPVVPYWTDHTQSILRQARNVAQTAFEIKAEICIVDDTQIMRELKNDLEIMKDLDITEPKIIGLLGGSGKSSTISSLSNWPEIAMTGDWGGACTAIVTEFRLKSPHQSAAIGIEADYLTRSEVDDHVAELYWSYKKPFQPSVLKKETTAEELAAYERESQVALDALTAAFGKRHGWSEQWLKNSNEQRVTNQLLAWARELKWPEGAANEHCSWQSTTETTNELIEQTKQFMTLGLWLFTKVIRVFIDSPLLRTGIVLADLPGLQDTNTARVRVAQNYLARCDHIILVARIIRAITDQTLKSSLDEILSRQVSSGLAGGEDTAGDNFEKSKVAITVVCTSTDQIDVDTAERDLCGEGKPIGVREMGELNRKVRRAQKASDDHAVLEAKMRRERRFINARNEFVKEGLEAAYKHKVENGQFEVFCVSNKSYKDYCTIGNQDMVLESGIPELRKFLYTIPAEGQYARTIEYINSDLASKRNTIEIWAGKNIACQEDPIITNISAAEVQVANMNGLVEAEISDFVTKVFEFFVEHVFKFGSNVAYTWTHEAGMQANKWATWHWTQYNAWCRNNGIWKTASKNENWNQHLLWKPKMELALQWEILEEQIAMAFDSLDAEILIHIDDLKMNLQELELPDKISEGLDLQKDALTSRIHRSRRSMEKYIDNVLWRQMTVGNESSYMFRQMLPAYRGAATDRGGKGIFKRQRDRIEASISRGNIYANILNVMKTQFKEFADQELIKLQKQLFDVLEILKTDMTIALKEKIDTMRMGNRRLPLFKRINKMSSQLDGIQNKLD